MDWWKNEADYEVNDEADDKTEAKGTDKSFYLEVLGRCLFGDTKLPDIAESDGAILLDEITQDSADIAFPDANREGVTITK